MHKLIKRSEIDLIVNACDAGREGELIFAYVYETAGRAQAGQAAVAQLDDAQGDRGGVQAPARRRGDGDARGRRPVALRGRLGRGHERHPRGVDPPAQRVRRRRLARPRPDADARAGRAPRGGDPRLQARALLARRGRLRGDRRPRLPRPLPGRQADRRGRGRRRSSRPSRAAAATSRRSTRRRSARRPSSSTTSPRSSATPTRSSASPRAARSPPRRSSTRSTRRSPTRVRTRASCRATRSPRSSRPPSWSATTASTARPPTTCSRSTACRSAAS